jgi:hypothetical protein
MNLHDLYIKVPHETELSACYWDNYQEKWCFKNYLRPVTQDELRDMLKPKWISIAEGLPEVDTPVYVITEYLDTGKPWSDYFIGYMDEYSQLICCPNDEDYGWQFNDCVTHWMPLPTSLNTLTS